MVQALANLYDEKQKDKDKRTLGIRTYDARWYSDLDKGLRRYVQANERAWKEAVEKDKDVVVALEDNIGGWAEDNLLSMLGAPDVVAIVANAPGKVVEALADSITFLLRAAGIDIDVLKKLKDSIVNALMKSTIGMTKDEFAEMLRAEADIALFSDSYADIQREIGVVPTQASWPHGPVAVETDEAKADAYVEAVNVNGPLYNTIILGKIALLSPEEFERLACAAQAGPGVGATRNLPSNVMLESWLDGIDFSRQCQWKKGEREPAARFLGYSDPHESPVFRRIFKPYPPIFQPTSGIALAAKGG